MARTARSLRELGWMVEDRPLTQVEWEQLYTFRRALRAQRDHHDWDLLVLWEDLAHLVRELYGNEMRAEWRQLQSGSGEAAE